MGESPKQLEKARLLIAWASAALVVTGICGLIGAGAAVGYQKLYEDRMYPGVAIAGVRVDGMTKGDARTVVLDKVDSVLSQGLRFTFKQREIVLDARALSTDPDASRDLVRYDIDQAVDQAFLIGRGQDRWQNLVDVAVVRLHVRHVPPSVFLDRAGVANALETALKDDLVPVRDAALDIRPGDPPRVTVRPERSGVVLITEPALAELERRAQNLDLRTIGLSDRKVEPAITAKDIEPLKAKAIEFLERPIPTFTYKAMKLVPSLPLFAGWVAVTGTKGAWSIGIDADAFSQGLHALATEKGIEVEAKNGSLVVKDGEIDSFIPGTEGVEVDTKAQYAQFVAEWPATTTFPLLAKPVRGTLTGIDPERLGIKELLGVGRSNFSGSPTNRRKNIALGVKKVNGTLIPPGEEFSMIKTLGKIDKENGWFPELVIKGNATEPEFGGGLCQIGTTAFRGALSSGMPIVERRNHSYRVSYYEPAGTDATIYDPKPDFRFMNDTSAHILISARIVGDNVIFDFWGTKDGRVATAPTPRVFNIVEPPPMKLIETLELAPGKKKCTETAHAGATAEFTYTIAYPNGTEKKEVFRSYYRPWQAVCLVGVEKLSSSTGVTSTEAIPVSP